MWITLKEMEIMNRNIVFTEPGKVELIDCPMPEVRTGEVLVRIVRTCLSSGTERANLLGVPDNGVSIFSNAPDGQVTWPRQGGYSSSGVVESVGDGVTSLKVGDRVAMCWTVHADYVSVPEHRVFHIPEGVSFEAAAFANIATFPLAAIRKCRLELGESAIVMGQGVLGQLAVKLLKVGGAMPVVAADPDVDKRKRAIELGADYAFDPMLPDFAEAVKSVCDCGGYRLEGRVRDAGAKVAIEVTGRGVALDQVLDAVAPFARVALLGCTRDSDFTINYYRKVHGRGITLVGAHTAARPDNESSPGWWSTRDDAFAYLKLVAGKRLNMDGFVSGTYTPDKAPSVYAKLAKGGAFPVVQFDWIAEA